MRRTRKIFLTTCAVILIATGITAGTLYWRRQPVEGWLEHEAIKLYLKKIEPELPFKIEKIEIGKESLKDLLNWKVPSLALVLRHDDWRARLSGPMELKKSKVTTAAHGTETETSADYRPVVSLERVSQPAESYGPFDTHISLRLHIKGAVRHLSDLADIHEAKVRVKSDSKVEYKPFGIAIDSPYLRMDWVAPGGTAVSASARHAVVNEGSIGIEVRAKAASWASPASSNRAAGLSEPAFTGEVPFELIEGQKPPFKIGPDAQFGFEAKSGEVLWDDEYLNPPCSALPVHGTLHLAGVRPEAADVSVGPEKTGVDLSAKLGSSIDTLSVSWKSRGTWQLSALAKGLLQATSGSTGFLAKLGILRTVDFKKGTLRTEGSLHLADSFSVGHARLPAGDARIALDGIDLDFPGQAAAIRGLKLELAADTKAPGLKGALEIPELYFKRAKGKLGHVPFSVTHTARAGAGKFDVSIGDARNLPLELSGVPFHVGSLKGKLDLDPPKGSEGPQYDLFTRVEVPPLGVERLVKPFCLPLKNPPPALLSVQFPTVELSNGVIDPDGQIRIDLFEGNIIFTNIGLFDLFTEVPETDFTMDMKGIRLDQMGNWSHLGEVDGLLEGYAHDVTIQSWLPTRFDVLLQAKPHKSWNIVFSPEAMENLVKLLAEDALEQMPGIVHWFMFGWPSRWRGYDVDWAGISAFSRDGNILLETLDPPEEKAKGNHFILYGTRFKMPLKSSHYPLIVDNSAMSSFVRQKVTTLINLAEQKRLEHEEEERAKGKSQNEITQPQSQDSDSACLPDVLRPR